MKVRAHIKQNLPWKLGAFLLALLCWIVINSAVDDQDRSRGFLFTRTRSFVLPVAVCTVPGDLRSYALEPPQVSVVVRGTGDALLGLSDNPLRVFVDLVDMVGSPPVSANVLLQAPAGVQVVGIEPAQVKVLILPPSPAETPPH